VAQIGATELVIQTVVEKKALVGGARREESVEGLSVPGPGVLVAVGLVPERELSPSSTRGGRGDPPKNWQPARPATMAAVMTLRMIPPAGGSGVG
jgi:hypothetical protein